MPTPLVEVSNLKKQFSTPSEKGRVSAVDGVSLAVNPEEVVGLVGESGCGKTTLGRCIVRLEQPTAGTVKFRGQDVFAAGKDSLHVLRRKMQIVFQDPFASLDPRWRIMEILEEPLRIHKIVSTGERKQAVSQLLSDVGLPKDAAYRYPHEFSGGQRQRIGIARALALQPEFLVADEPVSALDASVRAQILNLLRKFRDERGIAILFIGHDLAVVRQISSRILVMYAGVIVESAPANALFDNPRHPYTRGLLAAIPSIYYAGAVTHGRPSTQTDTLTTEVGGVGCRFRFRCPFAMEQCRLETPLLADVEDSAHHSACHFRNDLPAFIPPAKHTL